MKIRFSSSIVPTKHSSKSVQTDIDRDRAEYEERVRKETMEELEKAMKEDSNKKSNKDRFFGLM